MDIWSVIFAEKAWYRNLDFNKVEEQYSSSKNLKENQSNGEKDQPFPPQSRMTGYSEAQLQSISKKFQIYGEILRAEACKIGHINETYIATYGQGGIPVRYVHQKINKNVFKKPTR